VRGDFSGVAFEGDGMKARFFRDEGGKFLIETEGPDGKTATFEVAYTFGWNPLQQYLIRFPGGRMQAFSLAWDVPGKRWFFLYPGKRIPRSDWLHWTRNGQNWNGMCAECHSTNLRKGYRPAEARYETTFSEITVSCEACHGPASAHVAWARERKVRGEVGPVTGDRGLVVRLREAVPARWVGGSPDGIARRDRPRESQVEVETCARCHARRGVISEDYVHGRPILDTHRVALLEERLYYADGQILDEVYEYGSFLQSRMYQAGVTCTDCHDPHRVGLRGDPDATCAKCHEPSRFSRKSHHFHAEGTKGASCVECHMASRTYMVVDLRRDHSFRIPRPDLTAKIGTPNACNGCHTDRSAAWAATAVERWYGPSRRSARPHYGEALHAGRRRLAGAGAALEVGPVQGHRLGESAAEGAAFAAVAVAEAAVLGEDVGATLRRLLLLELRCLVGPSGVPYGVRPVRDKRQKDERHHDVDLLAGIHSGHAPRALSTGDTQHETRSPCLVSRVSCPNPRLTCLWGRSTLKPPVGRVAALRLVSEGGKSELHRARALGNAQEG